MVFKRFWLEKTRKKFSLKFPRKKSDDIPDTVSKFSKVDCEQKYDSSKDIVESNTEADLTQLEEQEPQPPPPPSDRFYFTYICFVYLGLTGTISSFYVFSANDFWMWKFRNTSRPWMGAGDAENRTDLQASVFSLVLVANAVPALISLAMLVPIVKRTRTRPRIYTCYGVFITSFFLFFALAGINTDSWQIELAAVILVLAGINSGISMMLIASNLTLVAYFSQNIVKAYTLGDGSSQLITSIIQIGCLLIGGNSQTSGIIYFGVGTSIYIIGILLYVVTRKSQFYRYYINEASDPDTSNYQLLNPTLADFKVALKDVWPIITVYVCCIISINMDNISNLIVSEFHGDGTAWSETYFVPVITMCLGNAFGILGRLCAWNLITANNCYYIIIINIVKALVFLPLYIGCNAFPRTLPVWFPHDWEYIIIMATFTFSNGFFTTSSILSLPNFITDNVHKEIYYILLQLTLASVSFCTAPMNILVVKFIL